MSEQVRIILDNQANDKQVIVKGFLTKNNLDRFSIGTIERNQDFVDANNGTGDFFGIAGNVFQVGAEVSEADFQTFADDNGYDMTITRGNQSDVIFDEIPAPSSLTAVKNGGSPTDTIDLTWVDNSSGASQETGFEVDRRQAIQEVTTITCDTGANHVQGDYAIVKNQAGVDHLYWLDIDAAGTEPTSARFLSLKAQGRVTEVDIVNGDSAIQVADKVFAAISATFATANMTVTDPAGATADIVISQDVYGVTEDAIEANADGSGSGAFTVVITADGSSTTFALITTEAADATTFQDTGLTTNVQYFYRVRAVDAEGESNYSNIADDTTD